MNLCASIVGIILIVIGVSGLGYTLYKLLMLGNDLKERDNTHDKE